LSRNTNNNFNLGLVPWNEEIKKTTESWLSQDRRLAHCPGYNKFPKFGGYCFVGDYGASEYEVCYLSILGSSFKK